MPDIGMFATSISQMLGCLGGIFWVCMLIHCARNSQLQRSKAIWFLLIFFTQWIGALIYFLVYIVPKSFWGRFGQWLQTSQATQWSTSSYWSSRSAQLPPHQPSDFYQPYQAYERGYQAQSPQYSSTPTPVPTYTSQEEQAYTSSDYEQPQTMYPEMPPQP